MMTQEKTFEDDTRTHSKMTEENNLCSRTRLDQISRMVTREEVEEEDPLGGGGRHQKVTVLGTEDRGGRILYSSGGVDTKKDPGYERGCVIKREHILWRENTF